MKANAIVNTANPHVAIGAGVDTVIYEAAGWQLEEGSGGGLSEKK